MDLYTYADDKFHESHPDWKRDTTRAYEMWLADPSDEMMAGIMMSVAPGVFYVSYRYTCDDVGYSRRDAFSAGMERVPYSVKKFDIDKSPSGSRSVASFIMWASEMHMLTGLQKAQEWNSHVVSMAEFDEETWAMMSESVPYDGRRPVADVLGEALDRLPPMDGVIARARLMDDMTWDEVLDEVRRHGSTRTSSWGISRRFSLHILPKLQDALRHAGYDEDDV